MSYPLISYLSVLQALVDSPLVVLDPEGDEIGGPVQNALDRRQLVHRRHRLLQEVATPGNPASAVAWFKKVLKMFFGEHHFYISSDP